jgi:hypothetical protein
MLRGRRIGSLLQKTNAQLRPSGAQTKDIAGANRGAGAGRMAIHEGFAAQRYSSGQDDRAVHHLKYQMLTCYRWISSGRQADFTIRVLPDTDAGITQDSLA